MPRWIVKIGRYNNQIRITIPKALAEESGLFGADLAEVKITGHNKLEVITFDSEEDKARIREGHRHRSDRSSGKD